MKFLFVNDSAELLGSLRRAFFNNPNVAFAECHNVEDALRAITEQQPDVVFLDHHLTDDGNEGIEITDRVEGVKIYSTTSNSSVVPEYQKRGIENVGIDLGRLKSIIAAKPTNPKKEGQAMTELTEREAKLNERLGETVISDELRRQILSHADNKSLVIASSDVAAVLTSRSEWGSSGGIGYYDQVRVFCGSQADMKEWQWRDRYSASNDKPWLSVHGIGEVKVSEKDNKVNVEVELVNNKHGKRTATYTFDPPKPTAVKTLSVDEQATFTAQVEKEMARVMAELNRMWEFKPKMVNSHPMGMGVSDGYVPYRRPSIKQREFHPEIGVAAFVTEEQIDHRVSDPQIRHELYVLTAGSEKAKREAEDHGYDREGGAFLTILEIGAERIVINAKSGKVTIALR